jgi:hypothetical protein
MASFGVLTVIKGPPRLFPWMELDPPSNHRDGSKPLMPPRLRGKLLDPIDRIPNPFFDGFLTMLHIEIHSEILAGGDTVLRRHATQSQTEKSPILDLKGPSDDPDQPSLWAVIFRQL